MQLDHGHLGTLLLGTGQWVIKCEKSYKNCTTFAEKSAWFLVNFFAIFKRLTHRIKHMLQPVAITQPTCSTVVGFQPMVFGCSFCITINVLMS